MLIGTEPGFGCRRLQGKKTGLRPHLTTLSFPPPLQLSPIPFGRPALALAPHARLCAAGANLGHAPRAARLILFIELLGDVRPSALVGQRLDGDCPLELTDADRQLRAGRDLLRGLHPFALELYLAADHCGLCETAGLEKASRPEPLIETHESPC